MYLGGGRRDDLFATSGPYCVCIEKFINVAKNQIVVVVIQNSFNIAP